MIVYKKGDMIRSCGFFRGTIIEHELRDGEVIWNVRQVIKARGTKVSHGYTVRVPLQVVAIYA